MHDVFPQKEKAVLFGVCIVNYAGLTHLGF